MFPNDEKIGLHDKEIIGNYCSTDTKTLGQLRIVLQFGD
jgi:hypothetical protein